MERDRPYGKPLSPDFNYWYFGTAAVLAKDGPEGPIGKAWNRALREAMLPLQAKAGHAAGSWSTEARWSQEAGRVHATAMNALTLALYAR